MTDVEGESALHYRTEIGQADSSSVAIRSYDVVNDLMGNASYSAVLLLAVTGEMPSASQLQLLDAVLVSMVDHGMQPSALVARLTYHAAPDALQGALAAGLLGTGSVILGGMEDAGKLVCAVLRGAGSNGDLAQSADEQVAKLLASNGRVPGLGHSLHQGGDPRAVRLRELAVQLGQGEAELTALSATRDALAARTGRRLEPNVTGVGSCLLLSLGIPWQLFRGIAVISRAAGLLAHIGEEMERPISPEIRALLRDVGGMEKQ